MEAHGVRKWKEIQEGCIVLKDRTAVSVCVLCVWSSFAVRLGTYSYSSILKAVGGRWIARTSGVI